MAFAQRSIPHIGSSDSYSGFVLYSTSPRTSPFHGLLPRAAELHHKLYAVSLSSDSVPSRWKRQQKCPEGCFGSATQGIASDVLEAVGIVAHERLAH